MAVMLCVFRKLELTLALALQWMSPVYIGYPRQLGNRVIFTTCI